MNTPDYIEVPMTAADFIDRYLINKLKLMKRNNACLNLTKWVKKEKTKLDKIISVHPSLLPLLYKLSEIHKRLWNLECSVRDETLSLQRREQIALLIIQENDRRHSIKSEITQICLSPDIDERVYSL